MLPRQTKRTRISVGDSSGSADFRPPLKKARDSLFQHVTDCMVPAKEAAIALGVDEQTVIAYIKRGPPWFNGAQFLGEYYVMRYEMESARIARTRVALGQWTDPGAPPPSETPPPAANYHTERMRLRRRATPPWANRDAIADLYRAARKLTRLTRTPHHVDHIIPLQGRGVTGLHVETNLRVIPARENHRKSNRFDSPIPNAGDGQD